MRNFSIKSIVVFIVLSASISLASLSDGLVAYWSFDEGTGSTTHDSANGHNGTIYNAQWTQGISGNALYFDGNNNYVRALDHSDFDFPAGFSLCAWVKPTYGYTVGGRIVAGRILYRYDTISKDLYFIDQSSNNNGAFAFVTGNNGTSQHTISDVHSIANQWAFVVGVRENDGTMKIYVDGILQSETANVPGVLDSSGDIFIGCDLIHEYNFQGIIDDVRVYNRALTSQEIAQLAIPEPGSIFCMILGILAFKKKI